MFRLAYESPSKIQGTIRVSKPVRSLGLVADVDGDVWDIHSICDDIAQACLYEQLHPYFTDTSAISYSMVEQSWLPYRVEVVSVEGV